MKSREVLNQGSSHKQRYPVDRQNVMSDNATRTKHNRENTFDKNITFDLASKLI